MQEDDILRRGVDVVDGMLKRLEEGQRIEIADVMAILKFLRRFGDEHGDERLLISEIQNALMTRRGKDFVRSSRQLTSLLRNQFNKEKSLSNAISEYSDAGLAQLERKYCPKPVMNRLTQAAR